MTRWQHFDGQGAALLEPDGRVRLFVSDELAEFVEQAERAGVSADEALNRMLDMAEEQPPPEDAPPPPPFAEGTSPVERLVPRDWPTSELPDFS